MDAAISIKYNELGTVGHRGSTQNFRLALAAGGIAAMLPGFLEADFPIGVRSGGALAAFGIAYFVNPASLTVQGTPTSAPGVFLERLEEDGDLVEYYWKQADVRFRFPKGGWTISTKAAESGLGDLTLQHRSGKDAQVQIHVSILDDKYQDSWKEFQKNTIGMWKRTIEQFGPFQSDEVFVDGRSSFVIIGSIRGEVQGIKNVNLVYAPLDHNRLFEMHLTRNDAHPHERDLLRAFELISSTIRFSRRS